MDFVVEVAMLGAEPDELAAGLNADLLAKIICNCVYMSIVSN